ncbi:MAG TPA: phospholipase D family protein [Rhodocyclaceae bacterium]|nr:phospholipase D family protein [Rhodocyclaceae bacterium]
MAAALATSALAAPIPATGTVEVAFTPWDDAEGLILRTLREAKRSVLVQAYVLTSRNIAAALQEAKGRGVDVHVMADQDQHERSDNSLLPQLVGAGIPVRLETRYSAAHNKVMVLDADTEHPTVITGSYNYSWSAQARNAENLLVLKDNHQLAAAYKANWLRHWQEAEPLRESAPAAATSGHKTSRKAGGGASVCAYLSAEERRLMGKDCRR